jgi:DNA-binding FrmR family transcriptional regulator
MSDCCGSEDHNHPDHKGVLPNLNRASGQLEGIKKMSEERRYCPDIMTQLRATRSALKSIEGNILEAHLSGCLTGVLQEGSTDIRDKKIAEIKEIFKRYDD